MGSMAIKVSLRFIVTKITNEPIKVIKATKRVASPAVTIACRASTSLIIRETIFPVSVLSK
ncbi:hypothetical protein ES703_108738 [subsurface metagenome]